MMKKTSYLMLLFAVILSACSTVPLTDRKQFILVSDQEVLALGLESYNEYISTAQLSTDTLSSKMVKECGTKIQKAVEEYLAGAGLSSQISGYSWEYVLTHDSTANAFCLPGGKVVVYDGLLPYTKNVDELDRKSVV